MSEIVRGREGGSKVGKERQICKAVMERQAFSCDQCFHQ